MSNKTRVYKTPQAVRSFINRYRSEARLGASRDTWEALEANLARLETFLLSQCELPLEELQDALEEDERETRRPPPTGGWEW